MPVAISPGARRLPARRSAGRRTASSAHSLGRNSRQFSGHDAASETACTLTGARGFTNIDFPTADVSATPVWIEIDLGTDRAIGSVTLHPRTDINGASGGTAGFPVDFAYQTRPDGAGT